MAEPQPKSKAQLRAERRAIQEAQRAAKAAGTSKKAIRTDGGSKSVENKPKKDPVISEPKLKAVESTSYTSNSNVPANTNVGISDVVTVAPRSHVPSRKQETHRVHLFKHLREPNKREDVIGDLGLGKHSPIHPCFLALGVNFDEGRIWGANERCLSFLSACETLIRTHEQPRNQTDHGQTTVDQSLFARSFGPKLQRHVEFLDKCRPMAVTIHNTYQFLKQTLNQLDSVEDWEECRTKMLAAVDEFRQTSIYLAGEAIAERASASIRPGECICTFGYSSVVARVIEQAWQGSNSMAAQSTQFESDSLKKSSFHDGTAGDSSFRDSTSSKTETHHALPVRARVATPFSVLVVDSRPRFEGRRMLARLTKSGIPCEYTHVAAFPMLAHKVSLAIFGAHALLNNGHVLARVGTAQVANLVSAISHAPTLVCAETYKFWERAHSDAFEYNELGDPDDIWRGPRGTSADPNVGITGRGPVTALLSASSAHPLPDFHDWRANGKLRLLHLVYDVLPPELVAAVVTEKGTLPTTSVPVVLRVKQAGSFPL